MTPGAPRALSDLIHRCLEFKPAERPANMGVVQEALGHQLPNQLVALQGLARLLEEGEGGNLSPKGREQLGRLKALRALPPAPRLPWRR